MKKVLSIIFDILVFLSICMLGGISVIFAYYLKQANVEGSDLLIYLIAFMFSISIYKVTDSFIFVKKPKVVDQVKQERLVFRNDDIMH